MFARFGPILTRVSSQTETDSDLLERFTRHKDEASFAALVGRHGPMVMGACRRILGDTHSAEDAFQAAFLVLARKAAGLPRTEALAGWLYGVARRVALKARFAHPCKPLPVREPQDRGRDPLAEMTGREILTVLEEELQLLHVSYRLPVVLCCLEGLTLEEAASRLGCTTGALRGRLERGRVRLRTRLTERGLAPAAVLAVASVPRIGATSTLRSELRARTAQAALNFHSRTGTVPDRPRHLAEGVLHATLANRFKLVAAALIATSFIVPALLAQSDRGKTSPAAAKGADRTESGDEPESPHPGTAVTGRVLSEPGGKEVAGVVVTLWNGEGSGRWTTRTDAKGAYSFPNVKPGDHYRVWIGDEARANREAGTWSEWGLVSFKDRQVKADDLFVEMPQSVSGTVTDADTGKSVPGAEINFSTADRNRDAIKTDRNGRYRLFVSPRDADLCCNGTRDRYEESEQRRKVTVETGKNLENIDFKVRSAPPFTGLVILPDGKPAKGAEVYVEGRWTPRKPNGFLRGCEYGGAFRLKTDDEGRFLGYMVGALAQGGSEAVELQAIAMLPDHTLGGIVRAKSGIEAGYRIDTMKVVLSRSASVTVRVVDPDGKPVNDPKMIASTFPALDLGLSGPLRRTGEGKYLMAGLVPGVEYHLTIRAEGLLHEGTRQFLLKPAEVRELGDIHLEWWGKKAVPALIKGLQSTDTRVRDFTVRRLGEFRTESADAVPALVEKLKHDPVHSVRFGVAETLGKIGPAAKTAVPDLIKALQEDTGGGVQREAATALGLIGDPSALPVLEDALKHSDRDVTIAAAGAIKRLETAAKKRPSGP